MSVNFPPLGPVENAFVRKIQLENVNATLKKEIALSANKITDLLNQTAHFKHYVTSLTSNINNLQQQLSSASSQIYYLDNTLCNYVTQLHAANSYTLQSYSEITRLQTELAATRAQHEEQLQAMNNSNNNINEFYSQLNQLLTKVQGLEQQIAISNQQAVELERMNVRIESACSAILGLEDRLRVSESQRMQAETTSAQANREKELLSKQLAEAISTINQLQSQNQAHIRTEH